MPSITVLMRCGRSNFTLTTAALKRKWKCFGENFKNLTKTKVYRNLHILQGGFFFAIWRKYFYHPCVSKVTPKNHNFHLQLPYKAILFSTSADLVTTKKLTFFVFRKRKASMKCLVYLNIFDHHRLENLIMSAWCSNFIDSTPKYKFNYAISFARIFMLE